MPDPQIIQHLYLATTLVFLLGSLFWRVCFPCAYFLVSLYRPSLYYPLLGQIRFELIVAIWGVMLLVMSGGAALTQLKNNVVARSMLLFLLVIFVSMPFSFNFTTSWNWVYDIILPNTLVTLSILAFCSDKKELNFFLWVFSVGLACLGYEAVSNYLAGEVVGITSTGVGGFQYSTTSQGRATGHTGLANYFVWGMPTLWFLGISSNKLWGKLVAFGLFAFCSAGVLISGARGGLVGLVVVFVMLSFLSRRPIFFLFGSLSLLIFTLPFMGDKYLYRMLTILEGGGSDLSANSRILGLVNGIEMMIKRPILGVGPGCYPLARKAWFGWSLWAHNHYGQLAGELGLVGIVIWYQFARNYIRKSWQVMKSINVDPWSKDVASAVFVTSILLLVLGMVDHSLYKFIWYVLAAVIIRVAEIESCS